MMNHKLMLSAGCAWDACLTFDPDQCAHPPDADRRLIRDILRSEFSDPAGFVLKDPRLCLTLPAWLPALWSGGLQARALIVVRHPNAVVRSLAARSGLPEEETVPHWLHHMLEAERLTRGMDRAVLFYEDLLHDWRTCLTQAARKAGLRWPNPVERVEEGISAFLSASPRRHEGSEATALVGPPPIRDLTNAAWIALRRLADDLPASDPLGCLDEVRGQFAVWRRKTFPPGFQVVFPDASGAGR